jgi:hypothetical protein
MPCLCLAFALLLPCFQQGISKAKARHKQVAFTTMFHIVGKSIAGKAV